MNSTSNAPIMLTLDSLNWLYEGVDRKFDGGTECNNFLSLKQRMIETVIFVALGSLECWWAWQRLTLSDSKFQVQPSDRSERLGKRLLLVILCMTFGVEIGFKFATKTVIFLLNPCHMLTVVQIYLLAAPPSKLVRVVFRMQMNSLSCPLLALLLPNVSNRLLPFEYEVYWIQHMLIYLIIPCYLLSLGGVYKTEGFWDFSWCWFTAGFLHNYHFLCLQPLGLLTEVNLNVMVCPSQGDPFRGPFYRCCGFFHQHLLFPLHVKTYTYMAKSLVLRDNGQCNGHGDIKKID